MKWGLVCSGGIAYGIANAGVCDVLFQENLKPDCIAGSSMGAIVGGLVALGHGPDVLLKLCSSIDLWKIAELSDAPFKNGLHGGILRQGLRHYLEPLIGDATIGDCKIPFLCLAGRVQEPIHWERIVNPNFYAYVHERIEPYVFPPDTKLMDAMLATSAVPVTFSPVKIGDDEFIDLLSFGAIPSRSLREHFHPDVVIATDTNPKTKEYPWAKLLPPGWREFLEEGEKSLNESRKACDLVIVPHMTDGPLRFDRALAFYEAGKKATIDALPDIQKLLT